MGKFLDKVRQVFNLFLLMLLVVAVAAVFVYFLSSEETRGTTFWMSLGFMGVALVLATLFASRVALRGDSGRAVPGSFVQLFLVAGYFLFTIVIAVVNARVNFSTTGYLLIHVGGLAVFLIPLLLTNMAMLKQDSTERREQRQGRVDLALRASRVRNLATDLEGRIPQEDIAALKKLSESLQYSDPTPAPRALEDALDDALKSLEAAAHLPDGDDSARAGVARACTLAGRALAERNTAVLNSK